MYLWATMIEEDPRRPLAAALVHRQFQKKWSAQREVAVRAFWDEHGHDSAGWGRLDLQDHFVIKMNLTWDQAFAVREVDHRFVDGRIVVVRARKKKLDLSAFLSAETLTSLNDPDIVMPIRYDKIETNDVVVDADDPIGE